jgi:hypothetical protein
MVELRKFIIERQDIIRTSLNDYKKWFEGDKEKEEEIDRTIEELDNVLNDANEFYPITHLSKEDIKSNILDYDYNEVDEPSEEEKKIDNLTDEQMIAIANNMSESFNNTDDYSLALKEAYSYITEERK